MADNKDAKDDGKPDGKSSNGKVAGTIKGDSITITLGGSKEPIVITKSEARQMLDVLRALTND